MILARVFHLLNPRSAVIVEIPPRRTRGDSRGCDFPALPEFVQGTQRQGLTGGDDDGAIVDLTRVK